MPPRLLATSDLHVSYPGNRDYAIELGVDGGQDWLIIAGDLAERSDVIELTLAHLVTRFAKVIWVPGNHELWTVAADPLQLNGVARYDYLVERCRELGVVTPQDPFPVWESASGPVIIAPLFALYDYSFRAPGTTTKAESLEAAYASGVVCTDERLLKPDPYSSCEDWCRDRVAYSESRLAECDPNVPIIMVNHWPLVRDPTFVLRYPEFAQWCGTELTANWHTRYRTEAVIYGHLHIPRTTFYDGVRFEEVSLGYPREWGTRRNKPVVPRQILPATPVRDYLP